MCTNAEVSSIPLKNKWDKLLYYIKDKGYNAKEIDRMISGLIFLQKQVNII